MTYEVVDFRKPGRVSDDIGQMLTKWQNRVREALEIRWGRCLASVLKIDLKAPAPLTGSELRDLDNESIIYRIDIKESGNPTLLVVHRRLALSLVNEMLGNANGQTPEDRPLTDIESTCMGFLIDEFLGVIQAGQKLSPPCTLKSQGPARLKELHADFPGNVTNTDVSFEIQLPYQTECVRWVLPQNVTLDLVAASSTKNVTDEKARTELERLILSGTCELKVRLGQAKVPLSKLTDLKVGDVIIMNQRIEEPLVAELGGKTFFRGWSGRIGKQQAFQIDDVIDSSTKN